MKGRVTNAYLLNLLARAQLQPKLWKPEHLNVRLFRTDLQALYPHLHFWNRKMQLRPPPVVSCLTCGSVHEPGHTIYHYLVVQCKNCPGQWKELPWRRRMDLERVTDQVNWFMSFLSDKEYNYYCEEVLSSWLVSIRS